MFDGKDPAPLAAVVPAVGEPGAVDLLVAMADGDPREQQASTWILLAWLRAGNRLDQASVAVLLGTGPGFEHWEATLHLFQMLERLVVPPELVDRVFSLLSAHLDSDRKLLRAWAYSGLGCLARDHTGIRPLVTDLLDAAEGDEAGSVRVRVRKAREMF